MDVIARVTHAFIFKNLKSKQMYFNKDNFCIKNALDIDTI